MSDYTSIPASLKSLKQWVCYRLEPNEKKGKPDKIPYNPRTGYKAKANDPSTWADYETAANAAGGYDGIGIEFANGIFGVDLDHVIENGELTAQAQDIIKTLDSYTEYSPSGTGVHILCRGEIPPGERRSGSVEMYSEGRFFTVTGNVLGEPREIQERTAQAATVHSKYLKKDLQTQDKPAQAAPSYPPADSDNDILQRAFSSKNGDRIRALWGGDTSGYGGDHSRADLALCSDLAYWTNGDPRRMDDLFRQSGLMRPKWDERRGANTYGEITIAEALKGFTPYTQQDYSISIGQDTPSVDTQDPVSAGGTDEPADPRPDAASRYMTDHFLDDIGRFIKYKHRKTGFDNLDKHATGLYPGLYVIGAIPSLGKTTFIHQMGDQLAAAGDHVLYFSLEQNRLEMITKSLSRITAQQNPATAVSAINIRGGQVTAAVLAAADKYKAQAERVSIIALNFDTNINIIRDYITRYIKANDTRPIVIIDYLQIIPPTDPRQSDKEKTDSLVRAIKKLQSENDLVIFVVSSFNRNNYTTPVDYESFKESGGIEYTADVVWGLQLQALNDDLFNSDKNIKKKREAVKAAKGAIPRKVELVCLKNRYGKSDYACGFEYDPVHDLFTPDPDYEDGYKININQPTKRL